MENRKINQVMILPAEALKDNVSHAKAIYSETFSDFNVYEIENNPMQPRLHIDECFRNRLVF